MNEPPLTSVADSATPVAYYRQQAGVEPLPGYRLLQPLGKGGFGEVWECEAPGGLRKAIKFVFDDRDRETSSGGESLRQEYEAFQQIKLIRHPFLLTLERVELLNGHLVMVMELADQNLADRFDECRSQGLPGVPREELLGYLADAAEALDVISSKHRLQHLDVKPANLFLVGGRAKVGDYGLLRSQQGATSSENRGLTPRYVAPEVLLGRVDPRSDQYSLALVYQELLTNTFPYEGKSPAHMMFLHTSAEPNLRGLPAVDRLTVARALAKNPEDRWNSCAAFIESLMSSPDPLSTEDTIQNMNGSSLQMRRARLIRTIAKQTKAAGTVPVTEPVIPAPVTQTSFLQPSMPTQFLRPPSWRPAASPPRSLGDYRAACSEPGEDVIELVDAGATPAGPLPPGSPYPSQSTASQPPSPVRLKKIPSIAPLAVLSGGVTTAEYCPSAVEYTEALVRAADPHGGKPPTAADLIRVGTSWECRFPIRLVAGMLELKVAALREVWQADLDWPDPSTAILRLYQPAGFFAKLAGRQAGAEVVISFPDSRKPLGEVHVVGRLFGAPDGEFSRMAAYNLPRMVDDVRTAIQNYTDHRTTGRTSADFPMQLFPITSDGEVYPPVWARCKNVSAGGVCFETPNALPTGYVYVAFSGGGIVSSWAILTRLLRSKSEGGVYVVAGRFRTDR